MGTAQRGFPSDNSLGCSLSLLWLRLLACLRQLFVEFVISNSRNQSVDDRRTFSSEDDNNKKTESAATGSHTMTVWHAMCRLVEGQYKDSLFITVGRKPLLTREIYCIVPLPFHTIPWMRKH